MFRAELCARFLRLNSSATPKAFARKRHPFPGFESLAVASHPLQRRSAETIFHLARMLDE
jgi:hypothetical protein